jgi:hypothetical protein
MMNVEMILRQVSRAGAVCLVLGALASCSSGGKKKGLPTNLPSIALSSSAATPPHNMPSYTYPFDSNGMYVSSWAAEGERRAGRSAANSSDVQRWSGSHRSSRSTSGSSSSSSKPKPKVTTSSTAKRKPTSSGGGSRVHVVKKGDTLYALARRYGSTVAKIKAANGLRSDLLRLGVTLKIPK